jgi:hypothetical protein
VHVRRENNHAKFWIDDVELAAARGFARHELRQIERIVHLHRGEFLGAWHEYFGQSLLEQRIGGL